MGFKRPISKRIKLGVVGILLASSLLGLIWFQTRSEVNYSSIIDTYNPLTFKDNQRGTSSSSPTKDFVQSSWKSLNRLTHGEDEPNPSTTVTKFQPINNIIHDKYIHTRLNNDLNNDCYIYTFFNDERIRKLPTEEQNFHKLLLRKWMLLYNSLGFKVNILHYNDAILNPKFEQLVSNGALYDQQRKIKESYLKLLAWETKTSSSAKGSLFSDYTIFPITSDQQVIDELKSQCHSIDKLTLFDDYEYHLMISNHASLSKFLEELSGGNSNHQQSQPSSIKQFNQIFADYSIPVFQKLLNSNNIAKLVIKIPTFLDQHLKTSRIINRYKSINIVDPISISNHYFTKEIVESLQSFIKCDYNIQNEAFLPPPTREYLRKFDKDTLPNLPDRSTADSDITYQSKVEMILEDSLRGQKNQRDKCLKQIIPVTVSNSLPSPNSNKVLNLVAIPHPASISSSLQTNEKGIVTNDGVLSLEKFRNFASEILLKNEHNNDGDVYDEDGLLNLVKFKKNGVFFFNAELLNKDELRNDLSILLGVELKQLDLVQKFEIQIIDDSKPLNQIINEDSLISNLQVSRKLDTVKKLILDYEKPSPFIINQRQSLKKIKEFRRNLKKMKRKKKIVEFDPKALTTELYETRHDPIIEISENWNPKDSNLWHLVKNLRYLDSLEYELLTSM